MQDMVLRQRGLRNFYNEFLRIRNLPASHSEEKEDIDQATNC